MSQNSTPASNTPDDPMNLSGSGQLRWHTVVSEYLVYGLAPEQSLWSEWNDTGEHRLHECHFCLSHPHIGIKRPFRLLFGLVPCLQGLLAVASLPGPPEVAPPRSSSISSTTARSASGLISTSSSWTAITGTLASERISRRSHVGKGNNLDPPTYVNEWPKATTNSPRCCCVTYFGVIKMAPNHYR